jgi:hypothetical protein
MNHSTPPRGRSCSRQQARGLALRAAGSCSTPGATYLNAALCGVSFAHLRHIMPDHAGDRGAVFLVLAPHDHLHIKHERTFVPA